jgi:hypothetical protein
MTRPFNSKKTPSSLIIFNLLPRLGSLHVFIVPQAITGQTRKEQEGADRAMKEILERPLVLLPPSRRRMKSRPRRAKREPEGLTMNKTTAESRSMQRIQRRQRQRLSLRRKQRKMYWRS